MAAGEADRSARPLRPALPFWSGPRERPERCVQACLRHGRGDVEAVRFQCVPGAPRGRLPDAGGPSPGPLGGRRGSAPAGPGPADRGPPGPAARGAQDHAPTRRLGRVAALRGVQRPPVRGRAGAAARGGRRHPQRLRGHAAHHGRDGGPRRGRAPAPGLGCEPRARDEEGVDSVWCVPAGLGTWRLRTPPATAVRPGRCTADASFLRHLALTWR
mmetsp:Transcript_19345/g.51999  ORF Transcript_19345/g.51999 Transcript_19345/m.51999 type:complete len:215 (+) Transcript_19345:378-1022(+)